MSSEFYQLFGLIMPKSLPTEEELQHMVRPLQHCLICNYVLCSCGNCHNSELCDEECLYDQSTEEEAS